MTELGALSMVVEPHPLITESDCHPGRSGWEVRGIVRVSVLGCGDRVIHAKRRPNCDPDLSLLVPRRGRWILLKRWRQEFEGLLPYRGWALNQ